MSRTNTLQELGVPVIHWDTIIISFKNRRLHQDLRDKWCRTATNQDLKQGKWPKFKQFIEFLETECYALESAKIDQRIDTSHKICYCPQFLKITVKSRAEVVKTNKLCFNCLNPECQSFKCTSRACLRCSNKHNTLLHIENYKTNANKQNNKNEETINESNVNCASVIQQPHVLQWTAKVHVKDINSSLQKFRALLDNGSQSNFVTQQCISDMGLTATSRITRVSGVSALSSCSEAVITSQIMSCTSTFKQNLDKLLQRGLIKLGNHRPILHETALGWVVAGQLNLNYNTQNTASYLCTDSNCQATETINQAITKFWRVE
ncbi:hypothetical protein QTP88_012728 [Uroleucon formosanum]